MSLRTGRDLYPRRSRPRCPRRPVSAGAGNRARSARWRWSCRSTTSRAPSPGASPRRPACAVPTATPGRPAELRRRPSRSHVEPSTCWSGGLAPDPDYGHITVAGFPNEEIEPLASHPPRPAPGRRPAFRGRACVATSPGRWPRRGPPGTPGSWLASTSGGRIECNRVDNLTKTVALLDVPRPPLIAAGRLLITYRSNLSVIRSILTDSCRS